MEGYAMHGIHVLLLGPASQSLSPKIHLFWDGLAKQGDFQRLPYQASPRVTGERIRDLILAGSPSADPAAGLPNT